ncbi:MAG: hypothetical protein ACK5XV_13120 [Flavobacteriales bacterium]|jgi:hypothetical protein
MNKLILSIAAMAISLGALCQAAFVLPSPTNPNDSVTIFIDVGQTTGGLKTMLTNNPLYVDSVYMWTWNPSGPVCGNGEWGNSNACMKMDHVSGLIFQKKILPVDFYGTTPLQFFQNGISCLAKLRSGYEFEDAGVGEAKTEDLKIDIIPALCSEIFCYFPEAARTDDYLSITYDNNQEANTNLQNLGDQECYIYMRARTGPFTFVEYVDEPLVTSTPELQMKPVDGKPGFFRITFSPADFFIIPEGQSIQSVLFYIVKPGYLPTPPVFQTYVPLDCE